MNNNVSTVSPLALKIETWTFHPSNGVMLRLPLRFSLDPYVPFITLLVTHLHLLLIRHPDFFLTHRVSP